MNGIGTRGDLLGEEDHRYIFFGIDPKRGAGITAPGVFTGRPHYFSLGGIQHHRNTKVKADTFIGGFIKRRLANIPECLSDQINKLKINELDAKRGVV